jgi:GTP cyclohydrolase I
MKLVKDNEGKIIDPNNVSDKEAEDAFRTILSWLGEDP